MKKTIIPKENYAVICGKLVNDPVIAVINSSLRNEFKKKTDFQWQLSIIVHFFDVTDKGLPTEKELTLLESFEKYLEENIKGPKDNPNAQFLARITYKGTQEFIYRVCNPEITDKFLKNVINEGKYIREFEYCMEHDLKWEMTKWVFYMLKDNSKSSCKIDEDENWKLYQMTHNIK